MLVDSTVIRTSSEQGQQPPAPSQAETASVEVLREVIAALGEAFSRGERCGDRARLHSFHRERQPGGERDGSATSLAGAAEKPPGTPKHTPRPFCNGLRAAARLHTEPRVLPGNAGR